jgi:phosphoglucomutase
MNARGDPDERAGPIRFGTSGWRGVLGEDFTFERVRAVVAAIGDRVKASHPGGRVLVAHDRRFLGPRLAAAAARVLAGCGVATLPVRGAVPTPVLAHGVRHRRAAAGLIFTASHNPPEYQGLKLFGSAGAGAEEEETHAIEAGAARWLAAGPPPECEPKTRPLDLLAPYLDALGKRLDRDALERARLHVVYDAMHGAGVGILDEALRRAGVHVEVLRAEPDPSFGGEAPDPLPERLGALRRAVRRLRGPALGLASDGDADRFAVVDADGSVLSETDAAALLVDHLARAGRIRRGVALSCATGSLVERVARDHGLPVSFHAMGFKHLSRALVAGEVDVAAEESGGFAWAPFTHDKDGILAGCLVAELVAASGEPLRRRLRVLEKRLGASASGRTAISADAATRASLARLLASPPGRVGGSRVRESVRRDGLRLALDDGFLMLRASGTEPLVRVYADAPTREKLAKRLRDGVRLLRGTARG